jgi:hypothetical protein
MLMKGAQKVGYRWGDEDIVYDKVKPCEACPEPYNCVRAGRCWKNTEGPDYGKKELKNKK